MIRRAAVSDIPRMVELGAVFHEESHYAARGIRYSAGKMERSLHGFIESPDMVVLVAESDGVVVGGAAAMKFEMYMTDDPIAMEIFWFMQHAERGSMNGIRMMKALEGWSKNCGAMTLCMISLGSIPDSPAEQIYKRLGYELAEGYWTKRL